MSARTARLAEAERLRLVARPLDRALAESYHLGVPLPQVEVLLRERAEQLSDGSVRRGTVAEWVEVKKVARIRE